MHIILARRPVAQFIKRLLLLSAATAWGCSSDMPRNRELIVGIVGGIGPESTVDYYRRILAEHGARSSEAGYHRTHVVINSINMARMVELVESESYEELLDLLDREVRRLAGAGVDVAAVAANTPHIVFDRLKRRSPIPLISIVEETAREANRLGLETVGLFGTRFTMQGGFYQEVFSDYGVRVVVPQPDEQDYIHERYVTELVNGVFLESTRAWLTAIVGTMKERDAVQGVVLGGTELPLILTDDSAFGIPYLNTTAIHVTALVDCMTGERTCVPPALLP